MSQFSILLYDGGGVEGGSLAIAPLTQFRQWADILESHYAISAPVLVAISGAEVVGSCFGYFHNAGGRAATLFVPRFAVDARDPNIEKALLLSLRERAASLGIRRSAVAYEKANLNEFFRWTKTSVELPLDGDETEMFAKFKRKSRYTIRRAAELFKIDNGIQYLTAFHDIYAKRMRDKRLAAHNYSFFSQLMKGSDDFDLTVAKLSGQVVAGMLWRRAGSKAYYLYNAATTEGLSNNANHLLMWEMIREYLSQGIQTLDLGESLAGGGVYAFKVNQFGGQPVDVRYADIFSSSDSDRAIACLPFYVRLMHKAQRFAPQCVANRIKKIERDYGRIL